MAATNDVRHLQKLLLAQMDEEPSTNVARLTREGELGYLLRMFFGHLHEAGIAFRNLDTECKRRVDELIARDRTAKNLFSQLRSIYNDTSTKGLRKALVTIRNLAFHYDGNEFADSLQLNWSEAKLVIAAMGGMSRYCFTDQILMRRTVEGVGGIENFQSTMVGDAIKLAGTLAQAVDHLLNAVICLTLANSASDKERT
jgi:hypothetical protein